MICLLDTLVLKATTLITILRTFYWINLIMPLCDNLTIQTIEELLHPKSF